MTTCIHTRSYRVLIAIIGCSSARFLVLRAGISERHPKPKTSHRVWSRGIGCYSSADGPAWRRSSTRFISAIRLVHHGCSPAPQCAEGAEDLPVFEGLAVPRGGYLSDSLCLQYLLAGADAHDDGRPRETHAMYPGDGSRTHGSYLVVARMDDSPICTTVLGHEDRRESPQYYPDVERPSS
jgi:hypothetical protein